MNIYPAIDLKNQKCVRLTQGDFERVKEYSDDPVQMAQSFLAAGSNWLHLIDLDGAKAGQPMQANMVAQIIAKTALKIQVGGGIRSKDSLQQLLDKGVTRVIIGSICVSAPQMVAEWLDEFGPEKIVLALDCVIQENTPMIATHGWQKTSTQTLWSLLDFFPQARHILCTDIAVDGTLKGPNFDLYRQMATRYPALKIQASGGVGSLADLQKLKEINVDGVVVGKALYEEKFTLSQALSC